MAGKQRNILVLSSLYHYTHMSQLIEYLSAYAKYSDNNYYYHNFVYDFDPDSLDLDQFDVVMITHNFWPMNLKPAQRSALAKTKALKALFLQDEYQMVRPINAVMNEIGIDLMFTCVAEQDFDVFYPKKLINSLKGVYGVLTGYVSDQLRQPGIFQFDNNQFDVGFRSRVSPYFLGRIGHEKFRIAKKFSAITEQSGLRVNISVNEEDRLSGTAWIQFLQSCKTQLGTPSGSSVIDFDGALLKEVASYRRAFPRTTYEEVFEKILKSHDGKHVIDTVSPRIFECAAAGSAMVNLAGRYGGIIEPGIHYIEVKSDYSNMSDVVEQIRDDGYCRKVANAAYADLIKSERYHFQTLVEKVEKIFEQHLPSKPVSAQNIDASSFYKGLIDRHEQSFLLDENGISYFQTPKAQELKSRDKKNQQLRRIPILRNMLARAGGEPYRKVHKGLTALQYACVRPVYRSLLVRALTLGDDSAKFEQVLKDILLLSIIKSSQNGLCLSDPQFQTQLEIENNCMVLIGKPAKKNKDETLLAPKGECQNINEDMKQVTEFFTLPNAQLVIDLTAVFPLTDFSNCILFNWPLKGENYIFRSAPDLLFHLAGLERISATCPEHVGRAIIDALTPCGEKEKRSLRRVFIGDVV